MHCPQCKARYCYRKLSVCLSVTLVISCRFGYFRSNYTDNQLRVFTPWSPNIDDVIQIRTVKNLGRIGVWLLFTAKKPAISLKRIKIGSRLLLMTNRKLHMCFRLVPKSILDDLEQPFVTGRQVCDDRFYGLVNRSTDNLSPLH